MGTPGKFPRRTRGLPLPHHPRVPTLSLAGTKPQGTGAAWLPSVGPPVQQGARFFMPYSLPVSPCRFQGIRGVLLVHSSGFREE